MLKQEFGSEVETIAYIFWSLPDSSGARFEDVFGGCPKSARQRLHHLVPLHLLLLASLTHSCGVSTVCISALMLPYGL